MRHKLAFGVFVLLAAGWFSYALAAPARIEHAPTPALSTLDGGELFQAYCASCHGPAGRSNAAIAARLGTAVPDLTRLAARAGEFDHCAVLHHVSGADRPQGDVMPAWSPVLAAAYTNTARERVILHNLVRHLESIQAPERGMSEPASTRPCIELRPISPVASLDGATLYSAYCGDCHGATGRGDGRLSDKLGVEVPDLTRLAAENGELDQGAVRRSIARRRMIPSDEAESWHDVLVASFGSQIGNQMLNELARQVETLQLSR